MLGATKKGEFQSFKEPSVYGSRGEREMVILSHPSTNHLKAALPASLLDARRRVLGGLSLGNSNYTTDSRY